MKTAENNAAIYCRLSKDDNIGNDTSASIQNQKSMLVNYVTEKGWHISRVYVDDGWTGTNYDRPAFKEMIRDIEDKKINIVVTKDLSRLGRNYVETGHYTEMYFPNHGVRYIAVNDGIDTVTDDNDIAPFKNILNEFYAKDISKKTRSAKKVLAEQGKFINSRAPFGYKKASDNKNLLVVDENVADIVRRIYSMFLTGNSGRFIADTFNRENIPTPNGYYYNSIRKPNPSINQSNKWGSGTIMNIIKNPVYKGTMAQGKRKVTSFKNKTILANPKDMWIVVDNTHEPIVNKATWDAAQAIAAKNHVGVRRSSSGEVSIFSGIAKCADCGTKMTYNRKVYKTYTKEYYRCGRYTNQGTNACKPHTILQETVYNTVLDDIRQYSKLACSDEERLISHLIASNAEYTDTNADKLEKQLLEKENRMKQIDCLAQSLFEEKVSGVVPDNIFKRMASKYDEELLTLSDEIDRLKNEISDCRRSEKDISGWVEKIKRCLTIETLTREIVVELIDSIEISEVYIVDGEEQQDVNITYRFENVQHKEKRVS